MRFVSSISAALAIVAFSAFQARAVDVGVGPAGGVHVDVPTAGVHVNTPPVANPALNPANVDVRTEGPAAARQEAREEQRLTNDNRPDQWRYKYEGNRWWYYGSDNRWMYYSEPGGWIAYSQTTPYTANYGAAVVTPDASVAVPAPGYVAPAPGYYSPGYGYYNNGYYAPGYYGGVYIGGPRWGVGVGGRRWR